MSATEFYKKSTARLPDNWHLMLIRVSIYSAMVGWGAFETGVEGYDTLNQLSFMQILKLCGNIGMSMSGVWLAFLDQTISKSVKSPEPASKQEQTTIVNTNEKTT